MGLRLLSQTGTHPSVGRSVVRLIGLGLAIVPCFLGFVPVLFDAQRRGLPDFMAHTVVLYADSEYVPVAHAAQVHAPDAIR
jgi:hypothetical protein